MSHPQTVVIDKELIRMYRKELDQNGTVPQPLIDYFFEINLFKLFVDRRLNGEMLSLPQALTVFRQAAEADGNVGWLSAIGAGGGMFSASMQKETAEQLFTPHNAVIAGSGFPAGIAKPVPGGYQISGEWKYCSGSLYASMFTANCVIEGTETIRSMTLMPEQVKIIQDWQAFGLRATGSYSIRVEDAFIPEERTFSIFEHQNDFIGDVHSFPFVPFSVASFTAVCLGIADHFFEEAKQLIERRWTALEEKKIMNEQLATYQKTFESSANSFEESTEVIWQRHIKGHSLEDEECERYIEVARAAIEHTRTAINDAIRHYGMDAVTSSSPLNQIWRDFSTAAQHTFLLPKLM